MKIPSFFLSNPKAPGIGIVDVLMTVFIIGLVALYTIPTVMPSISHSTALLRTKNFANNYRAAYFDYLAKVEAEEDMALNPTPTYFDVARTMKFVNAVATGNEVSHAQACIGDWPCFRFADGSVAQVRNQNVRVALAVQNGIFYDPDGSGPLTPVTLVLDPAQGRITTLQAITGTAGDDPAYVAEWTKQ